jgi:hypothetical protein
LSKKTREERRALKKARQKIAWKDNVVVLKNNFSLKEVEPLTIKQCEVFEEYKKGKNLLLYGIAGSGKTFLALYLALRDLEENKKHQKIIIVRSAVPSRDVGFMPGNLKEKSHSTLVKIKCGDFDKYGRLLAEIYTIKNDTQDISFSQHLLYNNLAYKYTGQTKLTESEQLDIL